MLDHRTGFEKVCGAKIKKGLEQCKRLALPNGRCSGHGGLSTGPRTAAGIEAIRKAQLKHGRRTKEAREYRRLLSSFLKAIKP